jgi:transcription termination/antitermination protein NusA
MEVVVEDKQLSLAIGKKGQNVRLAAKIVGWRIDIKSEEEKRQEVEAEMARMARIVDELRSLEPHGVNEKTIQKLIDSGIAGVGHVLEMTDEDLTSIEGIGPKTAEKIREAAAAAKAEWDSRDAAAEAERLEAERLDAERLEAERVEAERVEAERLEADRLAAEAEPPAEGEAAAVTEGAVEGEGAADTDGGADGQR